MSERLEIIKFLRKSEKTVAPGMQPSELISRKDVDSLINRIEELETQLSINTNNMKQLQNKVEHYKQALEFYAYSENWIPQNDDVLSEITMDYGSKARQALEGEK